MYSKISCLLVLIHGLRLTQEDFIAIKYHIWPKQPWQPSGGLVKNSKNDGRGQGGFNITWEVNQVF